MDIAVENDNGNPLGVGLLHDGRDGIRLVRRDDERVEMMVYIILYIGNLFLVAVVGRTDLHGGVGMKHDLAADLVVALAAPVIGAALRHTDAVGFRLLATDKQNPQEGKKKEPFYGSHSIQIYKLKKRIPGECLNHLSRKSNVL